MTEEKCAEIQQWLLKSLHDLGSARRLMQGDEPYLDTAVYHCQQAAEKALKAFLTYHDVVFEKTHNLTALLELCLQVEPTFSQWREHAEQLTPYAIRFRYPGNILEPERDEAEQALAAAETFMKFIIQLLPDAVKP